MPEPSPSAPDVPEGATVDPDEGEMEYEAADEQQEPLDFGGSDRRLVTQPYDLGVRGIADDISAGRISLDIEYQRKYVWDKGKASRLIESLLLNIPIPVCYFAEDERGVNEVIDGLQRLTTIRNFLANDFALGGLSVLSELNGSKFDDLNPRDRRRLENRTIRCIVITEDSHPDIKFDVFERLNTGAAMLTAQELRNSVYRGPFNDGLREIAKEPYFTDLVGASSKRMDLEELVLRFFSLVSGLANYKPPLRQFLNEYMRSNRQNPNQASLVEVLEDSCAAVHDTLGPAPFRMPGSKNILNKAMFDAIMVAVAFADRNALRSTGAAFAAEIEKLKAEDDFITAVGRATADRQRMLYRVGAVVRTMKSLGVAVEVPAGVTFPAALGGDTAVSVDRE